jgi:AraC-like DNA-binding protein
VERDHFVRRPWPELRPYVHRLLGYDTRFAEPTRQLEPPGPGVVLIFGLGSQLGLVERSEPERPPVRLGSFLAGPDDARTVLEYDGRSRGVQVDLTPLAARMLFRVPMHELARRTVPLESLLGKEAGRLEAQLLGAETWSDRLDLVESMLGARLTAAEPPPPDVSWAWRRLTAAAGRIRVAELARELGCTRKHLATRFREHVGLPPKLIARLLRFQNALGRLSASQSTIAEVAASCGYYDQAHLDREFRDFLATTPTELASALRSSP